MNRVHRPIAVATLLMLSGAAAHAHTLAGTTISVSTARPGIVSVTIAAEADPLIVKLEALAGAASSDPRATRIERRARLESLFPVLRANIDARIDGRPLDVELQDAPVDETAQVEMHLTAKIPDGGSTFTWRSTFIFGAYRLAIGSGDGAEIVEWLQGPQTSTPLELGSADETGTALLRSAGIRVGHSLAMGMLVMYFLRRRRMAQRLAGG